MEGVEREFQHGWVLRAENVRDRGKQHARTVDGGGSIPVEQKRETQQSREGGTPTPTLPVAVVPRYHRVFKHAVRRWLATLTSRHLHV